MVIKDEEFLKRLLATFRVEAQEHLKNMSSGLLELEQGDTAQEEEYVATIEIVFREAHSLKGAARSVNLVDIEKICQKLESIFVALKNHVVMLSPELFDTLHHAVKILESLLETGQGAEAATKKAPTRELIRRLEDAAKGKTRPVGHDEEFKETAEVEEMEEPASPSASRAGEVEAEPLSARTTLTAETVRISSAKLKAVLLQVEEMLSAKAAATQRAKDMGEVSSTFETWKKEWGKTLPLLRKFKSQGAKQVSHVDRRRDARPQAELHEFLETNRTFIRSLEERISAETRKAEHDARTLDDMVNNLLEDMKNVMMVPFSSFLEILPKYVRELSRDQSKDVVLTIEGGEIEIDRRILEEMKDPLIHLVRNCIDHGIEKPAIRKEKGKPSQGTITIAITPKNGSKVEISVADDGAGINLEKIRTAVQNSGSGDGLNEEELLDSLFQSGISTSPIITEISGRGLGLAIVREKVEKVDGAVFLETRPDAGAVFRIALPMTIATFRGVLVWVGGQEFILPTTHVERVIRVENSVIKTVENRETIELDGQAVSLVGLGDVLGIGSKEPPPDRSSSIQIVVLRFSGHKMAFVVDEVASEQEVLLKNLGRQLSRVRNIAGATVMGSGRVVPVLNVSDLKKSAVLAAAHRTAGVPMGKTVEEEMKSALVVEDSVTSRTLLKNILDSAGYRVAVAIDGVDAFTQLRSAEFDIVVTDVDMPRMNGFELTSQIRSDKKYAELPVIIVTALESKEDRERGIDVGANAYIVKSSFDHSNLLDIMGRLL